MPKIDLHTHSEFSDGTCSPKEVVHAALKAGANVFALTDHDTTDGVRQAEAVCKEHRILFTPGVEISTREHDHLHFTGYNLDLDNPTFQAFLAQNRQNRRERIRQIIRQLIEAGVNITEEDVFKRAPNTVSRAHVADALKAAALIQQDGIHSVVIDTEKEFISLHIAQQVAEVMKATYHKVDELKAQQLQSIVKSRTTHIGSES